MGSFNVLEAAAWNRVGRVIFMSSESVLGFAFSGGKIRPEYFPVDEHHPLRPLDPYGVSKMCGESMCEAFARRGTLTTLCLRPPWIWVPEESEIRKYRDLLERPEAWPQTLWAYVHVADVAEAVASALVREFAPGSSHTCFLSARENWTGQDWRELARRYYPGTRILEPERAGPYSLLSHQQASTLLGFQPRYSLHDLPGLEHS